jgi:hypothetical protein
MPIDDSIATNNQAAALLQLRDFRAVVFTLLLPFQACQFVGNGYFAAFLSQ